MWCTSFLKKKEEQEKEKVHLLFCLVLPCFVLFSVSCAVVFGCCFRLLCAGVVLQPRCPHTAPLHPGSAAPRRPLDLVCLDLLSWPLLSFRLVPCLLACWSFVVYAFPNKLQQGNFTQTANQNGKTLRQHNQSWISISIQFNSIVIQLPIT